MYISVFNQKKHFSAEIISFPLYNPKKSPVSSIIFEKCPFFGIIANQCETLPFPPTLSTKRVKIIDFSKEIEHSDQ